MIFKDPFQYRLCYDSVILLFYVTPVTGNHLETVACSLPCLLHRASVGYSATQQNTSVLWFCREGEVTFLESSDGTHTNKHTWNQKVSLHLSRHVLVFFNNWKDFRQTESEIVWAEEFCPPFSAAIRRIGDLHFPLLASLLYFQIGSLTLCPVQHGCG